MANPVNVPPVKLVAPILYVAENVLEQTKHSLEKAFSAIDYTSKAYPFAFEHYYEPEMGSPIYRIILSFTELVDSSTLADIKLKTNEVEQQFAVNGKRAVNIDSGYLDFDKLVLASMKKNGQKIYMGKGVWADMNLMYAKGHFSGFPWTFPDFADNTYEKDLLLIREKYKRQLFLQRKVK